MPVWVTKDGNSYRQFSYEIDIKSKIDWEKADYKKWLETDILPLLSERESAFEYLIDLERTEKVELGEADVDVLEAGYLTRRITDVVENAFMAFSLANEFMGVLSKFKDKEKLGENSGFVIQEIVNKLEHEKSEQEQQIFDGLIKNKKLSLIISSDENIGYIIPRQSEVYPDSYEPFSKNIFEKSDKLSMNQLELKVADLIDRNENVLWWVRNIAEDKRWYSVRGWKKGKIRPDFIAAKKNKSGSLDLVYIIESKGEHLVDNPNTSYKKKVFDKINNEKVEDIGVRLIKFKANKEFSFELVEEGKEELKISTFFNT